MNSTPIFSYLFILFILSSNIVILAQSNQEEKNYYNWFDQNIGHENTALFNGELHSRTYRTEDGNHNFLVNNDFAKGTLDLSNQKYYGILLKYDIYNDELIAKLQNSFGSDSYIQLNKAFIKAFTIHNKDFKFFNIETETILINGFLEVTHPSDIVSLLTKHYMLKQEYIVENLIYNKFSKKEKNILFYKNTYYEIDGKKDLKKIFPEQKKQINSFYKNYKSLKKSNGNVFMKKIIQQIEQSF